MISPRRERGTALLTVLLLVAVMAVIAATALDRLTLATRLAGNAATAEQARAWLDTAELIATTRIEDLLSVDKDQTTLRGDWNGRARTLPLPQGTATATVRDGGNCFNINSLVERQEDGSLTARSRGREQFAALMGLVGIAPGEAAQIAGAATDWIDSDTDVGIGGTEDEAYTGQPITYRGANALMADATELRAVAGVSAKHYATLAPWLCALPDAVLSPLNVNTLLPEQAPLVAMLAPTLITPALARAHLAARPSGGYGSVNRFWNDGLLAGIAVPTDASSQVQPVTRWFVLETSVMIGELEVEEIALIDAQKPPAIVVRRQWGPTN